MSMLAYGPHSEQQRQQKEQQQQQNLMKLQGQLQQQQQQQQQHPEQHSSFDNRMEGKEEYSSRQQQQQQQLTDIRQRFHHSIQHDLQQNPKSYEYFTCTPATHSISSNLNLETRNPSAMQFNPSNVDDSKGREAATSDAASMVLVSKTALSDLTNKIALSMDKMRDLEEQVRVIPELQRCLQHVINVDSESNYHANLSQDRGHNLNCSSGSNHLINEKNYSDFSNSNSNTRERFGTNDSMRNMDHTPFQRRRHSSFRVATTKSMGDQQQNAFNTKASNSSVATTNHYSSNRSTRSPLGSFRSYRNPPSTQQQRELNDNGNRNNIDNIANKHQLIPLNMSSCALNQESPTVATSMPTNSRKVEYEDLINDLISLSYSVNYQSSSNSNSVHSHSDGQNQVKEQKVNKPEPPCVHKQQQQRHFSSSTQLSSSISPSHNQSNLPLTHQQIASSTNSSSRMSNSSYPLNTTFNTSATSAKHHNQHPLSTSANEGRGFICSDSSICNQSSPSPSSRTFKNNNIHHYNSTTSPDSNSPLHHNYCYSNQRVRNNVSSSFNNPYSNQSTLPSGLSTRSMIIDSSPPTPPVKPQLDCGCMSFKEHLRYNSLSREQRLSQASKSQSSRCSKNNVSSTQTVTTKVDASTNTELTINDIVTRSELNNLLESMRKTYLNSNSTEFLNNINDKKYQGNKNKSSTSSVGSVGSQESLSVVKSSVSPPESNKSESSDSDNHHNYNDLQDSASTGKETYILNRSESASSSDDDDEDGVNTGSGTGEGPYSLGSDYQDPSDFEEYCAYGETLDRRTKDFMSPTTKIPNDLRFALIRLNDFIKKKRSLDQIKSASGCIEVVRKKWFEVAGNKDSQASKTKLYVDYFESLTKQLLNTVINLADEAGNTVTHYAASYYKLDVIKILLDTKVCDVNCRNKAGYTPIMLLALAKLESSEEQEIAKQLFSMGDVNIKARSSGQTALMLAASNGKLETCKLLLECGADPSLQDFEGSTALMCGSEIGNEAIVRHLLAHKLTDPSAIDNDGLDALTIAMNNGHKSIGLILYTAKNVPRMVRQPLRNQNIHGNATGYMGASLRRNKAKLASNYVKRADSLLNSRAGQTVRRSVS